MVSLGQSQPRLDRPQLVLFWTTIIQTCCGISAVYCVWSQQSASMPYIFGWVGRRDLCLHRQSRWNGKLQQQSKNPWITGPVSKRKRGCLESWGVNKQIVTVTYLGESLS